MRPHLCRDGAVVDLPDVVVVPGRLSLPGHIGHLEGYEEEGYGHAGPHKDGRVALPVDKVRSRVFRKDSPCLGCDVRCHNLEHPLFGNRPILEARGSLNEISYNQHLVYSVKPQLAEEKLRTLRYVAALEAAVLGPMLQTGR